MIERVDRELPFSCEQIFDLAADIERYPEFVPFWISARILRREGNTLDVEQVLGSGPMRLTFASRAVLDRPVRIDVHASGGPFRRYDLSMVFTARSLGSCAMSISSDVDLESTLLQLIVDRALPSSVDDLVDVFAARAEGLYGNSVTGLVGAENNPDAST